MLNSATLFKQPITISGASGFIGRHLVEVLLAAGEDLQIITRNRNKLPTNWLERVRILEADLNDYEKLNLIDGKFVFHLAGEIRKKNNFISTNVQGTENLLKICCKKNIEKFIHLSSVGVMGARQNGFVDEETICRPRNPYEKSKLTAELLVCDYSKNFSLPVAILRPSIVYGERDKSNKDNFLSLIKSIQSNRFCFIGRQKSWYNIIYVKDVIGALLLLSLSECREQKIFIINQPLEWTEFVRLVQDSLKTSFKFRNIPTSIAWPAALLGQALKILGWPAPISLSRYHTLNCQTVYSSAKIEKEFNYNFQFGHDQGLAETIKHYQEKSLI